MLVQFQYEIEIALGLKHVLDADDVRVLQRLQNSNLAHQRLLAAIKLVLVDDFDGITLASLLVHT